MNALPQAFLSAETDLLALKRAVASSRKRGMGLEWLPQSLAELDETIASWRASIEALRDRLPRLALLTAEFRLLSLEHRRASLHDAMQVPLDGVGERAQRVLVADDSVGSRRLSKHLLSAAGYDVTLAEDGVQAWELLQSECFDVVVLDALMPEPNGFELRRRIRADADLADVPVVLNTVLRESDEHGALMDAGANAYVHKTREDAGRQLVCCIDELPGKVGNWAR